MFHLGSTVVLLTEPGFELVEGLGPDSRLEFGQALLRRKGGGIMSWTVGDEEWLAEPNPRLSTGPVDSFDERVVRAFGFDDGSGAAPPVEVPPQAPRPEVAPPPAAPFVVPQLTSEGSSATAPVQPELRRRRHSVL